MITSSAASGRLKAAVFFWLCSGFFLPLQAADHGYSRTKEIVPDNDQPVELEPFVVSVLRTDLKAWRYLNFDKFEILSRATEDQTYWWANALRLGVLIEDRIIPKEWMRESLVPNTVIMDGMETGDLSSSRLRSQPLIFGNSGDAVEWGELSGKTRGWTDRLRAKDEDTYAVCVNTFGADTNRPACAISVDRILRCTPQFPRWLTAGLTGKNCGIFREAFAPVVDSLSEDIIQGAKGPGTLWGSRGETERLLKILKKNKALLIVMPSLDKLFAETSDVNENPILWESEAALLVRWGLTGPGRTDPKMFHAFMELVEQGRRTPITEKDFIGYFGFGFATMEEKLTDYLKTTLGQPISVELNISSHSDEFEMKEASADQVGRILGDWSRMQAASLKTKDPKTSIEFLRSAGQFLERAYRYDNGIPQPKKPHDTQSGEIPNENSLYISSAKILDLKLLSVYGLYENDVRNEDQAAELLEAATNLTVIRPKAYLTLAEIYYKRAMAKPFGSNGALSVQQVHSILKLLDAPANAPYSSENYRMRIETWEHGEAIPSANDIENIVRGVEQFPRYTSLVYHSGAICRKYGYFAQAKALAKVGLLFADDEKNRELFEKLRFPAVNHINGNQ